MGMLPSLSRIIVAMLGFVAVLVLHESLVTTTGATQVASSVETVTDTSVVDRSEAVDIADNDDLDVDPATDIAVREDDTSGQEDDTTQLSRTDIMDVGAESTSASSGELQDTMAGELEESEQARSPTEEDLNAPSASPTPVAIADSPARQWSAVWRPFFSPTTAQGFADYISESTGLTLRVQPAQIAGHYLVEVQHSTEAERIDADRRIVEYTGFKPPGAVQ